MKTPVRLLTKDCCDTLSAKLNDKEFRSLYNSSTQFDKNRLEFLDETPGYEIDESLKLTPTPEGDVESSIAIHEALSGLDRVQANDKRLWMSLTHDRFFKYSQERWSAKTKRAIKDRFYYEGSSIRTRVMNTLSRLWWGAELTVDDSRSDKYELTKALFQMQDLFSSLFDRRLVAYNNLVKAWIEVYLENKHLSSRELQLIPKGLNSIGGVKTLGLLSKEEIKIYILEIADYLDINIEIK